MTEQDLAQAAAAVLERSFQVDRESALSRDDGIAIVAQAMQRQKRKRFMRRRMTIFASAVTSVAAAAALWHVQSPIVGRTHLASQVAPPALSAKCGATDTCGGSTPTDVAEVDGKRFEPGSKLETAVGRGSEFSLHSGTQLKLAGATALGYDEGGLVHRFSLSRGYAEFTVKKQGAAERFLVNTPDSEIEVRGTRFGVSFSDQRDACGNRTQVTVSEGMVEVRSAGQRNFVTAGGSWPGDCRRVIAQRASTRSSKVSPATAEASSRLRDEQARPIAEPSAESLPVSAPSAVASDSDLARQNELFARATKAMHLEHYDESERLYGEIVTTYPNGPLAESAAAARLRARQLAREKDGR